MLELGSVCRLLANAFGVGIWNLGFDASPLMSQRRRVHHQHRDHAPKKNKQRNPNADEDSSAQRIVLLFLTTDGDVPVK